MADSNKPLVVGLAGFGTVGGGLARLLEENAGIIRQDHRVRLTIGVEFERDQSSVP